MHRRTSEIAETRDFTHQFDKSGTPLFFFCTREKEGPALRACFPDLPPIMRTVSKGSPPPELQRTAGLIPLHVPSLLPPLPAACAPRVCPTLPPPVFSFVSSVRLCAPLMLCFCSADVLSAFSSFFAFLPPPPPNIQHPHLTSFSNAWVKPNRNPHEQRPHQRYSHHAQAVPPERLGTCTGPKLLGASEDCLEPRPQ